MIEIELPCCEATIRVPELADEMRCEDCSIVFELGDPEIEPGARLAAA